MTSLRHSVHVDLAGNIARRARSDGRALQRFSQSGSRSMRGLQLAGRGVGRALDRVHNRYVALATGAAGIGAIRTVARLERRLNRLGVQANVSSGDIEKVKQRIFEVANAPDIRVDPNQIISAIEAIVEKTGDLDFAVDNIENIGRAIQASGGQGVAIGALIAEFKKLGDTVEQNVLPNLDTLTLQGKAGAFTIANMATNGERLVSAYAATGRVGPMAVRELGAIVQVVRQGTGSAEQATTAVEALLRTLQDADKIETLRKNGIVVFDPEQPGVMRSVADIMKEIVSATDGDAVKLSQVFDAEAMRAFTAVSAEFKRTGAVESLDRFLKIQGDGRAIVADSARIASDSVGAWDSLANSLRQFADNNLAGPLKDIADAANAIEPDRVQKIMKALAIGGAALGGLAVGAKLFKAGRGIARALRPGRAAGVAGAAAAAGAIPVRVVNWPLTFSQTSGVGRRAGRRGGRAGRAGRFSSIGRTLGRTLTRGAAPLAIAAGAYQAGSVLTDRNASARQKAVGVGRVGGGVAGAVGGAKAGGALGLLGGPLAPVTVPAGTLIGGAAGFLLGEEIGERIASVLSSLLGPDRDRQDSDTKVEVAIRFDGEVPPGLRHEVSTNRAGADVRVDQGFSNLPTGP